MTSQNLFSQLRQHVFRHLHHNRVAAPQPVAPVGAADGDDRAASGVRADDGVALAALLPLFVPLAIVGVPLGGRGGEDGEVLRRAVFVGGCRQAVLPHQFAAVTLVAHDGVLTAELDAAFCITPGEQPVVRAVNRVGAGAVHVLAVTAVIAAP